MAYKPIESYGVIGDLHSVALVGNDGSIDMMCFPKFDSPSIFAALLDDENGGCFRIAPVSEEGQRKQIYLPDSNVLLTRFLQDEGVSEVSDFMPIEREENLHNLVRRAKTIRGEVRFRMTCAPRFDYARAEHRVEKKGREVLFVSRGDDRTALRLVCSVPVRIVNGAAVAEFTLRGSETASFVLEEAREDIESPAGSAEFVSEAFKDTVNFWRRWIGKSSYAGRWRGMVNRSALTLKLLTSAEHGSMVAAPSFGLPEEVGGSRNWDYRYTWIRDASFTLYALIRLGYTDEAASFMRWIEARCGELEPDGSLQIMYGLDGRHDLSEQTLPHLKGYRGSSPVRIGNEAFRQLQLDIYGELLDSVYLYNKFGEPISHDLWDNLVRLIDWVCANWRREDAGIWEMRGATRQFLYSRLMCWVAVDRGIRLASKRSFPAPLDRWYGVRDSIYRDIFTSFWDPKRKAFVQYEGSGVMDAANLLMPLVRFIGPTDPRWLTTLAAIDEDLAYDSLLFRYKIEDERSDGLAGREGTFNLCSFWYVENLSRSGDVEKARFYLEKMLGYANHLGLYSEEIGPRGEHLGNFPQAFTHLALISAAHHVDRSLTQAGGAP